ncbi:MAG: ABC transporter permease [Candidatus Electrothrix sp. AX5]|nr:ABC transporter permease [Candidatus Electrothrix sp. AX5]
MHINAKKKMLRDPWLLTGGILFFFFATASIFGSAICPHDPSAMEFTPLSSPCAVHPLGVNDCGQDIFAGLICAVRNTVLFGLTCAAVSLCIGVLIGLTAGWFGGIIDMLLMRLADVLLAVPAIMVLILISALFQPPPLTLAVILALLIWPTISKAIRAQTLIVRESPHVRAAVQMGASNSYIIFRHLLPELFPLYLIGFSGKCRMAMFMEASLAFMGLIDPGRKSLGMMIHYALKYYYLDVWWNWLLPPVLCLSLLIMTVTFIVISLEKMLDPRLRETFGESSA